VIGPRPLRGTRHTCALLAAIASVAAVAAACSDGDSEPSNDDTIAATSAAAIGVLATGCSPSDDLGSGSMIDRDLAVTAAHVVAGATEVSVVDGDGAEHGAEVVWFDPDLDLAVLRTERELGAPLIVTQPAVAGDIGFVARRVDAETVVSDVRVSRTVDIDTTDIYLDREVTRPGFEVDAAVTPGDSGAVVVLPGGIAGGMLWARSSERNERAWAIDLPIELGDAAFRDGLVGPVPVGACTG